MNRVDLEEMELGIKTTAKHEALRYALICFVGSFSLLFLAAKQVDVPIIMVPALLSVLVYQWRYWRHMYTVLFDRIKGIKATRMEEAMELLSKKIATLEHVEKRIGYNPAHDPLITGANRE